MEATSTAVNLLTGNTASAPNARSEKTGNDTPAFADTLAEKMSVAPVVASVLPMVSTASRAVTPTIPSDLNSGSEAGNSGARKYVKRGDTSAGNNKTQMVSRDPLTMMPLLAVVPVMTPAISTNAVAGPTVQSAPVEEQNIGSATQRSNALPLDPKEALEDPASTQSSSTISSVLAEWQTQVTDNSAPQVNVLPDTAPSDTRPPASDDGAATTDTKTQRYGVQTDTAHTASISSDSSEGTVEGDSYVPPLPPVEQTKPSITNAPSTWIAAVPSHLSEQERLSGPETQKTMQANKQLPVDPGIPYAKVSMSSVADSVSLAPVAGQTERQAASTSHANSTPSDIVAPVTATGTSSARNKTINLAVLGLPNSHANILVQALVMPVGNGASPSPLTTKDPTPEKKQSSTKNKPVDSSANTAASSDVNLPEQVPQSVPTTNRGTAPAPGRSADTLVGPKSTSPTTPIHSVPVVATGQADLTGGKDAKEAANNAANNAAEESTRLPQASQLADTHGSSTVTNAQISGTAARSEIHLAMQADKLGSVELHARVAGEQVGANIVVEKKEAHAALAVELPALQQALSDKNLHVEHVWLTQSALSSTTGDSGQKASPQQEHRQSQRGFHGQPDSSPFVSPTFISDTNSIFDSSGHLSVRV